jgi:hypothetical protein
MIFLGTDILTCENSCWVDFRVYVTAMHSQNESNNMPATSAPRFSDEADKALTVFYAESHAATAGQKIVALEAVLGGPSNFYGFGGEVSDDMKLGCLEYEYLSIRGLVELVYV